MIMTAASLNEEDLKDLPRALKGNLCRCTGYHAIEDAIRGVKSIEDDQPGKSCGADLLAPAAEGIVTGKVRYTLDTRDRRIAASEARCDRRMLMRESPHSQ